MENMNIICCNSTEKYKLQYLKNFNQNKLMDNVIGFELEEKEINKKNPLLKEFKIFSYLYENSGLYIEGDFYFINSIEAFFKNDFFIGYSDYENISTNLIWVKSKNSSFIKSIIEEIKKGEHGNITDVFSAVLKKDLRQNYNYVLKFDENSYIYPYDYFYPADYERIGKGYSDNIKAIYIDNSKSSMRIRRKIRTLKKIGPTACQYLFATIRRAKNNIGYKRYLFFQRLKAKISVKEDICIDETFKVLDNYIDGVKKGEKLEYIIIHHPRWLGVTSATKELFENLVPIQEVYLNKNIDLIVSKILELNVNQVIFSAFDYGWDKIAIKIREQNPSIKLKSFWHGSHSQVIEEINWDTNLMVINLHKQNVIDVMGTCKASLVNFYKSQGYKTAFLMNTVRLTSDIKESLKNINESKHDGLKFGLYSAGTDWRKNTYNQVMATSLFENSELEVVPLRYDLKKFAYFNELKIVGSDTHIKREELLLHMAEKDVVLYVTFSECAPMLPIESLEVGTICIMGHNHHYFQGSKLHDYLVCEREDDLDAICEKIKIALENKEEIFKLYKEWKEQNDKESIESVKQFLAM